MSNYLIHYAKGYEADEHKYTAKEYYNGKWHYYYGDKLDDGESIAYPAGKKASNHDSIPNVRTMTGVKNQTILDPFLEVGGNLRDAGKSFVEKKLQQLADAKKKKNDVATK